jgi:hypothetical protein
VGACIALHEHEAGAGASTMTKASLREKPTEATELRRSFIVTVFQEIDCIGCRLDWNQLAGTLSSLASHSEMTFGTANSNHQALQAINFDPWNDSGHAVKLGKGSRNSLIQSVSNAFSHDHDAVRC